MDHWFSDHCLQDLEFNTHVLTVACSLRPKVTLGLMRTPHMSHDKLPSLQLSSAGSLSTRQHGEAACHPQAWRRMLVRLKKTLGSSKACIPFPALLRAFPSPYRSSQTAKDKRKKKRYGGRQEFFLVLFCSNLQETARRKNVPLIMTPLCFLKASFWTFKSPQISSPLFFFPLFFFPLFKLI